MRQKNIQTLLLFILIILFVACFLAIDNNIKEYRILKVINADEFYLDLNFDNKIDENELVRLKNVVAFSSVKNKNSEFWAKNLDLPLHVYLKNGYLAYSWAKNNLENKTFKIKNIQKCGLKNYQCEVEVEFNNRDLSFVLLENGLAHLPHKTNNPEAFLYYNFSQIKKNIIKITDLNFVLLNLKTNIVHKFSCEYSKNLSSFQMILFSHLKNAVFCKHCYNFVSQKYLTPKSKNIYKKSVYKKFDNIELYLINPLENKTPNKSCDTDVCKRIVYEINNSKHSIDIALYGFGEQEEIYSALLNAKNRGVKIRAVFDRAKNNDNIYPLSERFACEFDTVFDDIYSLMHNKFFVFDKKLVMTGSVNISSTGTGGYNANNLVFVKDIDIANRYLLEFEQMFNKKFSKSKNVIQSLQKENIQAYFSPKDDILNRVILPEVKNAKKTIMVSAFYFTDWSMINSLIYAKMRGVDVYVLLDALSAKSFSNRVETLRKNNIPTIVENWGGKNHEKTIVIDNKTLILGSCNFSKSGFEKNDENVLVIKNSQITSFYADYYSFLFNTIDKRYLSSIPRAESFDSINSCFDGIDNNFDGKIDKDDEGCRKHKNK